MEMVVGATMQGNSARFINHSCMPSCKSKCVIIEGKPRIIIFAERDIAAFEELTYDYKFAYDESDKVPCACGARNCTGFMN